MNNEMRVIGMMSGTSLDGIDLADIVFTNINNSWQFNILNCHSYGYNEIWFNKLKTAHTLSNQDLIAIDIEYTQLVADTINKFIEDFQIQKQTIHAICSHGHTILHQPQNKYTLQIGNRQELASLTKLQVVCNFRVQDIQLGGQGAPLVPIGDQLLFSEYDFCLNLGGFANISYNTNGQRIAFDICPVNTVLNHFAQMLGKQYDDQGSLASVGHINHNLLLDLNSLPYYSLNYPKSLGIEFVIAEVYPLIEKHQIPTEDILHTLVQHVVDQISKIVIKENVTLLATGGGSFNTLLITKLRQSLPKVELILPQQSLIEFKEAVIFGFLGVLKLKNQINILSSVTGASINHSSGVVYQAD